MGFVSDLRVVVRGRDFRRLYATRLTSQFSDGAFQVALASLFFFSPERQTSAAGVAGAFAVTLLPYSLVGPWAGVLLDRWRRRQVLVWANVVRTALVVLVAAMVGAGQVGPWLYVVVLSCLSVNRFFLAGLSAALPHVVPRDELVMANSVSTTSGTISALVGGGVGYGLKRLLGEGDGGDARLALVAAALYLLASAVAATMDRDLLGPDLDGERQGTREALRHVARGLTDGARHVWQRRSAAHALAAITAHRFAYGISTIAAILLYRNHFNDPADVDAGLAGLALVFGASGVGFFVAALVTPPATRRLRTAPWIVLCFAGAGVVELVYLAALNEVLVVVGAFVIGVAAQGSKICVDTIVQESVADAYRGRVFSFYDVLFNISFVGAAAFAALLLPSSGASRLVYGIVAVVYLATAAVYSQASRRVRVGV
ncbi:MAG: MFS transporter [Motilibacteraceae bacterium]